jgi:Domain of unknown function (DUF4304)
MTYSVKEIFEEILKESITPLLKKEGFKKLHYNYRKTENGLIYLINFQSSGYNNVDYASYYINCGIYCNDFETLVSEKIITSPKEYDCLFNQRLEQITNWNNTNIEIIESSDEGKQRIANELIRELEKLILFFNSIISLEKLTKLCLEKGTFFNDKLLAYFCINKDIRSIETLFDRFAEIFKDDDRYIFFESRLNDTLRKYGIAPMKFKTTMSVPLALQRKPN